MTRPRVYLTRKLPEKPMEHLRKIFEVEMWKEMCPPPRKVLIEKIREADGLISLLTDKLDGELLHTTSTLKIIAQYAVGVDNIDLRVATDRGIYVTNTPNVLTETTADFTFALIMSIARRVVEADRYIREGKWKIGWHPTMLMGRDIHGSTLGIVGLGRIGSAVARRAKGFNMKILYFSKRRKPELEKELGVVYKDLDDLLMESDFITLHVPLTNETHHLIGERELGLMKETAFLINTSRGSVVDEKALYKALKNGDIAGAALDVWEHEPTPNDNPLLNLINVVASPHIASSSLETRTKMAEKVAENLEFFFKGKTPPDLVNKEVIKIKKPSKLI